MVRVFKEDIQKRKEESDRKSGKGGSGTLELSAPELILRFFLLLRWHAGTRFVYCLSCCQQDLERRFCILNPYELNL